MSHVVQPRLNPWPGQGITIEQYRGCAGEVGGGSTLGEAMAGNFLSGKFTRAGNGEYTGQREGIAGPDKQVQGREFSMGTVIDNEMTPRPLFATPSSFLASFSNNEVTPRAPFLVSAFLSTPIEEESFPGVIEASFIAKENIARRDVSNTRTNGEPQRTSSKATQIRIPYSSPIGLTMEAFVPSNFNEEFLAFDFPLRKQLLKDFHRAAYQAEIKLVLMLSHKTDRQERQQLLREHNQEMETLMHRMMSELTEKQRKSRATRRVEGIHRETAKPQLNMRRRTFRSRETSSGPSKPDSEVSNPRHKGHRPPAMRSAEVETLRRDRGQLQPDILGSLSPGVGDAVSRGGRRVRRGRRRPHVGEVNDQEDTSAPNAWRYGVHSSYYESDEDTNTLSKE